MPTHAGPTLCSMRARSDVRTGAAKFEGKALLIHRTEEIVLRGTQAEEIERRKLDAGAGGEAGIAAHRLQFFQGGGDEERTKAR